MSKTSAPQDTCPDHDRDEEQQLEHRQPCSDRPLAVVARPTQASMRNMESTSDASSRIQPRPVLTQLLLLCLITPKR
jgi:hypothetical protein